MDSVNNGNKTWSVCRAQCVYIVTVTIVYGMYSIYVQQQEISWENMFKALETLYSSSMTNKNANKNCV